MPRAPRTDVANQVYHILNRSNARVQIFDTPKDYQQFEIILEDAVQRYDMRLLAYCIMPNHWHLVLYPKQDGDLSAFMSWLTRLMGSATFSDSFPKQVLVIQPCSEETGQTSCASERVKVSGTFIVLPFSLC